MDGRKRVRDEILIESYSRNANVWKVGKEVGMCGQSVHERLSKLGIINKMKTLTEEERNILLNEYVIFKNKGKLDELAKKMGREKTYICMHANKLGLTSHGFERPYAERPGSNPYGKYHARVRKLKGSPHKCEVCGNDDLSEFYEWANLTGRYEDPDDYKRMCRKCHRKYDRKDIRRFSKISIEIENKIIELCKEGLPQKEIADRFNVHKSFVSSIAIKNGLRRRPQRIFKKPSTEIEITDQIEV